MNAWTGCLLLQLLTLASVTAASAETCSDARARLITDKSRFSEETAWQRAQIESYAFTEQELDEAHKRVVREIARHSLTSRYAEVGLNKEQVDRMSQKEVDSYLRTVSPSDIRQEKEVVAQEIRSNSLAKLAEANAAFERDLSRREVALNTTCPNNNVIIESDPTLEAQIARVREANPSEQLRSTAGGSSITKDILGGENSEVRRIAKGIENLITANVEASKREQGSIEQVIRSTAGVSVEDIKEYGILGGTHSEARKICSTLFGKC